jgi:hypothetical protein
VKDTVACCDPRLETATPETIGGTQSTTAVSVTVTLVWPCPSSASTYVAVIVLPWATHKTPGASVSDKAMLPPNVAVSGPVSVSSTGSPAGSDVELTVTVTV